MLTIHDFPQFFRELTKKTSKKGEAKEPFPWQTRLAQEVWSTKSWERCLSIPTSLGKTSIMAIAVFLLALEVSTGGPRRLPLRIFFIVDRRVVVGQTVTWADEMASALATASDGVLRKVADALRSLDKQPKFSRRPIEVNRLQGGIPIQEAWAKRPDLPFLIVSTVDQVGSMLLHQGYRNGRLMRSVYTGLCANDSLLILDEVHIASAFAETLRNIGKFLTASWPKELPLRRGLVFMSATPRDPQEGDFGLNDDDRKNETIMRRLQARKEFSLQPVKMGDLTKLAKSAVQALEDLKKKGAKRILMVWNQVAVARLAFEMVQDEKTLLIGRNHPLHRQVLQGECEAHVLADVERKAEDGVFVVVSTQVIEVGADYDFDALITEVAPLDVLIQRFGRLNRRGDITTSTAVILGRSDHLEEGSPIYGQSLAPTWKLLEDKQHMTFGELLVSMGSLLPPECLAAQAIPPVLTARHLDHLVQTSQPSPGAPSLAPFLHGVGKGNPDVTLVWRDDLFVDEDPQDLIKRLEARPPTSPEKVPVPIWEVKTWMCSDVGSDLEGVDPLPKSKKPKRPKNPEEEEEEEEAEETNKDRLPGGRTLYRVEFERVPKKRKHDKGKKPKAKVEAITDASQIRPGDTLLVATRDGGLDRYGWYPSSLAPAPDMGTQALWESRGRACVWVPLVSEALDQEDLEKPEAQRLLQSLLDRIEVDPTIRQHLRSNELEYAAVPSRGVLIWTEEIRPGDVKDRAVSEDGRSWNKRAISLEYHSKGVAFWAKKFASSVGLPPDMVKNLEAAGLVHDLGKALPHWQVRALAPEGQVLAKNKKYSDVDIPGFPEGWRHEMLSLAMVQNHLDHIDAPDKDLVSYLVLSHHGWGRPYAPAVDSPTPVKAVEVTIAGKTFRSDPVRLQNGGEVNMTELFSRIDSLVPKLFLRMQRKYGWWGIAWLEAILRLADHYESLVEEFLRPKDLNENPLEESLP